jgi:CRP-like cAMP-binding protein
MDEIAEALAKVSLFRDVDARTLERLARAARRTVFPEGFEVVKEGDDGLGFFLVQEGQLAVFKGSTEVGRLKPGDWFGEMSLLDEMPRSATVTALEPSVCLALYRWDFLSEVRKSPDFTLALLAGLSRRVRELDERYAASR